MKKFVSLMIVVCFIVSISGCASIVSKSEYPVTISSKPEQANITITNDKGEQIYKGKTPTTLSLRAGKAYFNKDDYIITFEKEGCESQTADLNSTLNPWYLGNIIFGGLVGMLIVDPLTGAMWSLPSELSVNLVNSKTGLVSEDIKNLEKKKEAGLISEEEYAKHKKQLSNEVK